MDGRRKSSESDEEQGPSDTKPMDESLHTHLLGRDASS
jgi:hypothetical protein